MERLRPTRKLECLDCYDQELYKVMNARPDVVIVRRDAVDQVMACHLRTTGEPVHKALPSLQQKGRKYYTVNRMELFGFVNQHGKVCPIG